MGGGKTNPSRRLSYKRQGRRAAKCDGYKLPRENKSTEPEKKVICSRPGRKPGSGNQRVDRSGPFTITPKTHFCDSHACSSALCKVGNSGPERDCAPARGRNKGPIELQATAPRQGPIDEGRQG
ncbi:hypothetical protein mRhiFer1_008576 [Rhinolophus ferrumequinum]|uniref:Uncharacterized protein n=1 Tax=Rhinolophus ferrumequinum TaxID=59479 RepID=A0A7J7UJS6_RHIFE|nr:hypothetical protein mRhiFer1_008576 [Rhinolophus ferrumequinum]